MKRSFSDIAPWVISVVLILMIGFQIIQVSKLSKKENSGYIVIPVRLPLTRQDPTEALLIEDDRPLGQMQQKPKEPFDDHSNTEMLRTEIAMACKEIGTILKMPQLLFIMSLRDQLERDFYEGYLYQLLENKLTKLVEK